MKRPPNVMGRIRGRRKWETRGHPNWKRVNEVQGKITPALQSLDTPWIPGGMAACRPWAGLKGNALTLIDNEEQNFSLNFFTKMD